MSDTRKSTKPDRDEMQVKQQISHNLLEIWELYPQFSIAKHLAVILRKKDKTGNGKEAYHWDNAELLKRIQQYRKELETDSMDTDANADY